jgi:aminobenzoyl-glutamate utilization protein B
MTFAASMQTTFDRDDIATSYKRFGVKPKIGEALSEEIYPHSGVVNGSIGSTDVGTVSWVVPTVQCRVACYAIGTPGHSWQLVAQGKAGAAHKGLTHAAKIMATTAIDLLADKALLASAKAEHEAFRADNDFVNPITPDLKLDLDMSVVSK